MAFHINLCISHEIRGRSTQKRYRLYEGGFLYPNFYTVAV